MAAVLHYSLVDSSSGGQTGVISTSEELPTTTAAAHSATSALASVGLLPVRAATEVFGAVVRVFTFADGDAHNAVPLPASPASGDKAYLAEARKVLLAAFPHSLSTLCLLWSAIKDNREPRHPVGTAQVRSSSRLVQVFVCFHRATTVGSLAFSMTSAAASFGARHAESHRRQPSH